MIQVLKNVDAPLLYFILISARRLQDVALGAI